MVYVVVRQWMPVLVEEAAGLEGFERAVKRMASFFYVDDGIIALKWKEWIQWEFRILMGMFEQMDIQTNMGKTVGMVFQIFHIFFRNYDAAQIWRVTVEGPS